MESRTTMVVNPDRIMVRRWAQAFQIEPAAALA
jgi:hypothetical protein